MSEQKTSVDELLEELKKLALQITGRKELVDFELQPVELESISLLGTTTGVEVDITSLSDVTICPVTGVFLHKGQHVLLFIPDHSFKFEEVKDNPEAGNRFHLCDCRTIYRMMTQKRYQRYQATNNQEGIFRIVGWEKNQQADVALKVCKDCLNALDYQRYKAANEWNKSIIFQNFSLKAFFKEYQTHFNELPKDIGQGRAGYPDNWAEISRRHREKVNWCCAQCGLDLSQHQSLLDVHHVNGVKHDYSPSNLRALCKECHAKQPSHGHYARVVGEGIKQCRKIRQWQEKQKQSRQ